MGFATAQQCRPGEPLWNWQTSPRPNIDINVEPMYHGDVIHDYRCIPNIACQVAHRAGLHPLDNTMSNRIRLTRAEDKRCIIGPRYQPGTGMGFSGNVVAKRNRDYACPRNSCGYPDRTSCDEFPFASTYEGGIGDPNGLFEPTTYMCVPVNENTLQGRTLQKFYECMGYPQNFVRFDVIAANLPPGGCQPIHEGPPDANGIRELIKNLEPYTGPTPRSPLWTECIELGAIGTPTVG